MTDRPRALAVLIAVFLLGCFVGVGGTYFWQRNNKTMDRRVMQGPPGPPQGRQRMRELLKLTPQQEEQFGKIMSESRTQIEAVRKQDQPRIEAIFFEQQPKIQAIFAETNRKIMAILNSDQQKKFEALYKEMSNRRRHSIFGREGGRGGSPGMGLPLPPRQ